MPHISPRYETGSKQNAKERITMNEAVKFLTENPVQYLATVGRDGKGKCRGCR